MKTWMLEAYKNQITEVIVATTDGVLVREEYPTYLDAKAANPWIKFDDVMHGKKGSKSIYRFESPAAYALLSM